MCFYVYFIHLQLITLCLQEILLSQFSYTILHSILAECCCWNPLQAQHVSEVGPQMLGTFGKAMEPLGGRVLLEGVSPWG